MLLFYEWGILWHVDREIGDCRSAVARQRAANNNRRMVISAQSAKQQLNSNKGDNWSNELVVKQLSAGKNVSIEAEDVVGSVTRQRLVKTQQQTEKI
jgi:hypothetical protein